MREILAILLAVPVASCETKPNYYSTLQDSVINQTIYDSFHPTLTNPEKGRSNAGETPQWILANDIDPQDPSLQLVLTAPLAFQKNPAGFYEAASMGAFATGLTLDASSKFTLEATFQWPQDSTTDQECQHPGTASTAPGWTATLVAREGGSDDTYDLSRIQLSFKSTGSKVDMRVQQVDGANPDPDTNTTLVSDRKQAISPDDHRRIFCSGNPFTLKLVVNRKDGTGSATIEGQGLSYQPLVINLQGQFAAGSGPPLTAAGVALANAFTPGETVAVRVKDLKIWKE